MTGILKQQTKNKPLIGALLSANAVALFLCELILILPDDAFTLLPIYKNVTPSYILYDWLHYSFGLFLLAILFTGLLFAFLRRDKVYFLFILYCLVREAFYYHLIDKNAISYKSFEIYLTILTGLSFIEIVCYCFPSFQSKRDFYILFLILNMLTIFATFVLGGNSNIRDRCNAVNLDVGESGILCCILLIFLLGSPKASKTIFVPLTILAIYLTGSRISLIFGILILAFYFARLFFVTKNQTTKFLIVFFLLMFIAVVFLESGHILEAINSSRLAVVFDSSSMTSDDSYLGRVKSIFIGFDIIRKNPFGLSAFFTNLQLETISRGFWTFPHSYLIVLYLLLGPLFLFFFVVYLRYMFLVKKHDKTLFAVLLFLLLNSFVNGGVTVNFKIVFLLLFPLIISIQRVKKSKQNTLPLLRRNRV